MKFLLLIYGLDAANGQYGLNDGTWLSNGPFQMYHKGLGQLKKYNAYQNFQ